LSRARISAVVFMLPGVIDWVARSSGLHP